MELIIWEILRAPPAKIGMERAPSRTSLFSHSALSLLVALVLGTDDHDFAVSLDDFALVAHRFDRRSYFHFFIPPKNSSALCAIFLVSGRAPGLRRISFCCAR